MQLPAWGNFVAEKFTNLVLQVVVFHNWLHVLQDLSKLHIPWNPQRNWLGISVIPNQNMITRSSCPFPKVLYFYFKYLFLFSSVFLWVPGEARKGCEIPWLQAVVSCLTWVMGNELGSSRRTASAFASWFISPASQRYFVSEVWKGHCILCIVGSHLIVWVLRVS